MKSLSTLRLTRGALAAVVATAALACSSVRADLLSSTYETQLETWLGQGDLVFTNIFTKTQGSTCTDFHTAADNRGATFVLISIAGAGWNSINTSGSPRGWHDLPLQVIGGYNPRSWFTIADYDPRVMNWAAFNLTPAPADRTAFIFNLTNATIQRQNQGEFGEYQTYNVPNHGPTFGKGADIFVDWSLTLGHAKNESYGGTIDGEEIVFGGPNYGGIFGHSWFDVLELEVFTFQPAQVSAVPDATATVSLLAFGLLGLAGLRRRIR